MSACDSCTLPFELCTALAFIETLCVAAIRGEVLNAQHCAKRALELLNEWE